MAEEKKKTAKKRRAHSTSSGMGKRKGYARVARKLRKLERRIGKLSDGAQAVLNDMTGRLANMKPPKVPAGCGRAHNVNRKS